MNKRESYLPAAASIPEEQDVLEARMNLHKIAVELRSKVPLEGVLDSETIHPPTHGEVKDFAIYSLQTKKQPKS